MKIKEYLLFPLNVVTAVGLIIVCAIIFRKRHGYWASFEYLMDIIDKVVYEKRYKI